MIIKGHHIDEPVRDGEILEACGPGGTPQFRVLWSDTGHEVLFFPGPDASVQHFEHDSSRA